MDEETWCDPDLLRLQRAFVQALEQWHRVAPDPSRLQDGLSPDQRAAMRAAMEAESAYLKRQDLLRSQQ